MTDMKRFACVQKKTLLGLPLYEKYRTDDRLIRLFAGGFWREDVRFSSYGEVGREISLCGLPLWGRRIENNILSWHLGRDIKISQLRIADILERDLNRLFGPPDSSEARRHVFVLWANSGEIAMLFASFMPQLLEKMKLTSKDVMFLCTKPYHADMAKLYFPDVKTVVAKPKILRHVTQDLQTQTWNVNVFFTGAYFCEFERQAKRSSTPLDCIDWMSDYLGLPPQPPSLTAELNRRLDRFEEAADRKLGTHTDWSKTILISPSSFSCGSLSAEDTAAIHDIAVEHGFDVFFNNATGNRVLSFPELLSKTRHAAGIVGIRSGLMDFLVNTTVPMHIVYRAFPDRGFNTPPCDAASVLKMFSLKRHGAFVNESTAVQQIDLQILVKWFNDLAN